MNVALHLGALVAIIPATLGPLHGDPSPFALELCGGGSIEIPRDPAPTPDSQPCEKGCHSSCNRKRIDRAQ